MTSIEDAPDPRLGKRARKGALATTALTPPDDPEHDAGWFAVVAGTGPDGPARMPKPAGPIAPEGAEALAQRILSRMNPEQARAVSTTDGPLLILAGAGSGKTRVLAHRVAYLIGVKGVRPWQILAVTFTNKAAAEMRERILALVGEGGRDVAMGTFHALCARVLRRDGIAIGIPPRFTIYDTDDQSGLMKQVLRDLELQGTGELRPAAVLGAISRWKNELVGPGKPQSAPRATWSSSSPRPMRATRTGSRPPVRSTSTTCSTRPCGCSTRRHRCSPTTRSDGGTCTSTSTRTRTGRSTCA